MTQDLIVEDEIFGEEFIGDPFSSFWEPSPEGRVLKISPYARNELIRKVPKIKDNLEYLVVEKFKKMDYISTVRSSHLNTEDKVRYGFNFLSQRLGHTMNGDSSKREVSIKFHGYAFQYAFHKFKQDPEFVLEAVKLHGYALQYAEDKLKQDPNFVLKAVKINGYAIKYASEKLKNNRKIALASVKQNGLSLCHLSEEFRQDREITLESVKQNHKAIEFIVDKPDKK